MSTVAGIEFRQDALHVCLDRALGDVELGGDHFVRLPRSHPSQHFDLALGQCIVSHVLGDFCRDLRWHPALTRVHNPNGLEQLLSDQVLEQISGSPGFQCPGRLDVASVGREHDDASIGKFGTNGGDRFDTAHVRHPQVHECHIGPMLPKALYGVPPVTGLANEQHVRLAFENRGDSFTQQLMIVDGEDPNGAGVAQGVHFSAPPPGM